MQNHARHHEGETILMDDPTVTNIPVDECAEGLIDLGLSPLLMIDNRLADDKGRYRLVRAGLAERLVRAAESLPDELRLLIVEGYRPVELQEKYFNQYAAALPKQYPGITESEIHSLASRYVAPPFDIPPHCAGAAVDLTLAWADGTELDMGTQINASPEDSGGRCYVHSLEISQEQRSNRILLISALRSAGLVNYPTEWWHWSYGDRYWALISGAPVAIYGLIDTD